MNFITKAPVMLCGGDYNPDQWLDRPASSLVIVKPITRS